jgi:FdhD protein
LVFLLGSEGFSLKTVEERNILRFTDGQIQHVTDLLVNEAPLTVHINGREIATLVSSPVERKELTYGFLAAEGFIEKPDQVQRFVLNEREGMAWVVVAEPKIPAEQFFLKRYLTSCCGKSRPGFYYANDALMVKRVVSDLVMPGRKVLELMSKLEGHSDLFLKTGGVHTGALGNPNSNVLHYSHDIGRHNVLDKLYGWGLLNDVRFAELCMIFSGRVSSEVLLKVAKMGMAILIARSAPTGLALDLAEELGITVAGFVRGNRMNIYTCPERIRI